MHMLRLNRGIKLQFHSVMSYFGAARQVQNPKQGYVQSKTNYLNRDKSVAMIRCMDDQLVVSRVDPDHQRWTESLGR